MDSTENVPFDAQSPSATLHERKDIGVIANSVAASSSDPAEKMVEKPSDENTTVASQEDEYPEGLRLTIITVIN